MSLKKWLSITALFFVVCLLLVNIKFIGFVSNAPSRVTIELPIIVNYSLFDGSTTNFTSMDNNQLRDVEEMVLENSEYGKIVFQESIDLTQDSVNEVVDINGNVNISNNRIEVNADELTSLRRSATIYLYNLSFNDASAVKNGGACSGSVCQEMSYSSGTFIFNVTSFIAGVTVYSAEETSEEVESAGVSSGGGGGGGAILIKSFSLDKDLIKVSMKQGETKREIFEITNTGNVEINITLEVSKLEKFVLLNDDEFILKNGESKIIAVDFFAKENEVADSYFGGIIVSGAGIKETVGVILEIKERSPLFDVQTDVLNEVVMPGEKIRANITIINMGDLENFDVSLYYALRDFDNKTYAFREESLAIDKSTSVIKELRIPIDATYGQYVFYSKVSYNNISAASADSFEVSEEAREKADESKIFLVIITFAAVLVLVGAIVSRLSHKKRKRVIVKRKKSKKK